MAQNKVPAAETQLITKFLVFHINKTTTFRGEPYVFAYYETGE
jgi:hypothetical protein